MPTVCFHTLGCKLNQAETAALEEQFTSRGYDVVAWGERADVSVLNTCTVTSRSDSKCRQAVSHILNLFPETTVVVAGCYSQVAAGEVGSLHGVDYVLGTYDKFSLFDFFPGPGKRPSPLVVVSSPKDAPIDRSAAGGTAVEHTRAFLKIQTGCSRACAYCIVPLARGPATSLPLDDVAGQARALIQKGYREIVLTGTHIGDYGKDGQSLPRLPDLIRAIASIEGCGRIRLSSLDPEDMDERLLECVSSNPKVCRHVHLSIQSGSRFVIQAMNRNAMPESVRSRIEKWTQKLGPIGLGADVITGFPGESGALFNETFRFIDSLPFTYLHVFPFSPRKGTAAFSMPDPVSSKEKTLRTQKLRQLGLQKKQEFYRSWIGKTVEVLLESRNHNGRMGGWSSEYVRAEVPYDERLINVFVQVQIIGWGEAGVTGTVLKKSNIKM
jgi:threonylcarbamoyladenosine tRNA methylthiotransferase MtaB